MLSLAPVTVLCYMQVQLILKHIFSVGL